MIRTMILTGAALGLLGISPLAASGAQEQSDTPASVRLTYVKSPLNVPAILDKGYGLLEARWKAEGIAVERPELTSGPKQTEALASGSVDIATVLGGTSALLAASNGVDLKVVGIFTRAPEAYRILARTSIRSVRDLQGKTVAGPKGTILHQLLLAALKAEGLSSDAVQFVAMDIPAASAALASGSVDAALLAGAAASQAEAAGARVIATGKGLVNGTIVTAVRGEFLRKYPRLVRDYLAVHRQALGLWNTDPRSLALVMAETGLDEAAVKTMLPWYDFDPTLRPADLVDLEKTQDFLIEAGLQTNRIRVADLLVDWK